jgi:hypothetical protein
MNIDLGQNLDGDLAILTRTQQRVDGRETRPEPDIDDAAAY